MKTTATTIAVVMAISVSLLALGPITFGGQAAQAAANPHREFVDGDGDG